MLKSDRISSTCDCFQSRCACVLRGKVSERSRTIERFQTWRLGLALPSRAHAHDGNRLQFSGVVYARIISFHWLGMDRGWPSVSVRDVRVSYPRWFLLTLLFFFTRCPCFPGCLTRLEPLSFYRVGAAQIICLLLLYIGLLAKAKELDKRRNDKIISRAPTPHPYREGLSWAAFAPTTYCYLLLWF